MTIYDPLAEMLRRGGAPTLDELLLLAPFEPFIEREICGLGTPAEDAEVARLTKKMHALRKKFPGYQQDPVLRRNMKYGRRPPSDAPLSAWVRTLLYHAMAKWSGAIQSNGTAQQFRDWLPAYLENDVICWCGSPGLDAARKLLQLSWRFSWGLSHCPKPGKMQR